MATHGCIRCSKCGGACPLCGRCQCSAAKTLADSIAEEIDREILAELFKLADKNDEQKPETD